MDNKHLKIIYYGLAQSVLHYGVGAWGGMYSNTLHNLKTTQNIILRIMLKKPYRYSTKLLYRVANVCNIRQMYIMIFFHYKIKKQLISHGQNTRYESKGKVITSKANKTIGTRCSTYLAPRFYNLLPASFREIRNPKKFKQKLKKHLLECDNAKYLELLQ